MQYAINLSKVTVKRYNFTKKLILNDHVTLKTWVMAAEMFFFYLFIPVLE